MSLSNQDRKEIAHVIEITVTPLLAEVGATIIDEVEKINLKLCEMLGAVFTHRAGTVMDEVMNGMKRERERIIVKTRETQKQEAESLNVKRRERSMRTGFVKRNTANTGGTTEPLSTDNETPVGGKPE